jgi:hypothetical protein
VEKEKAGARARGRGKAGVGAVGDVAESDKAEACPIELLTGPIYRYMYHYYTALYKYKPRGWILYNIIGNHIHTS